MTAALSLIALLAVGAAFAYGLFLLAFKRGRRKRGLYIALSSVIAFVVVVSVFGSIAANDFAREAGFSNAREMSDAREEGIDDPEEWAALQAEKARQAELDRQEQERQAELERQRAAEAEAAAEAERKRKGFHCLSSWNGSHRGVRTLVRDAMRNPSSFEHVETLITPVDENGEHALFMTYRAENGFGGMSVGQAIATIYNETCRATVTSID